MIINYLPVHTGKVKANLRRMQGLPLGVLGKKIFGRGIKYLNGVSKRLNNSWDVSERELQEELGIEGNSKIGEVVSKSLSSFFINPHARRTILGNLQRLYPESTSITMEEAGRVLQHKIELLGYGLIDVGKEISWDCDFNTGKRWQKKYASLIRVGDINDHADIKVPWELSRFHHLISLGKAYWYTGDELFAHEAVQQIDDWIEDNPVGFGIHWTCAMEASIRVANWIWAYAFICDSKAFTEVMQRRFLRSLLTHGKFIMNNLENKHAVVNNHYLADLIGLIYISTTFPQFQVSSNWRSFALNEFFSQIKHQVLDDGVNFELTTGYHRLVLEMVVSSVILGRKSGYEIPLEIWKKIERMFEFVMYYTKPDGSVPQIGDDDDGRLLRLAGESHFDGTMASKDHRYLLAIGAVLFKRSDFARSAGFFGEEAFWLLGNNGRETFHSLLPQKPALFLESKGFLNAGIYVLRDDDMYMIVDCGSNGQNGIGGHNHNDTLSFELYAYDSSFIVDPGTYNYTGDIILRNTFRSTKYHNVLTIDGEEINRFKAEECFRLRGNTKVEIIRWYNDESVDILEAQHEGYKDLPGSPIHKRKIYFNKTDKYYIVEDTVSGEGYHRCELYFHLSGLSISPYSQKEKNAFIIHAPSSRLLIWPFDLQLLESCIFEGWISPQYGMKYKSSILQYHKSGYLPIKFITLFQLVRTKESGDQDHQTKASLWFKELKNQN